ncbi:uncharacterized protein LOC100198609 isoform X2 [Hydra vulgaris]|uniref:uncharacterized protein LOC100198609 isoform X2 n=1 Tax=Hydra vulgaris TaxID=6087 RepID=UPI0032E9E79A
MQKEVEKCLQRQAEAISPNQSEESFGNKGQEFKYTNCGFCQGIIPKYYVQRNGAVTHCSKICSEMTKIMKNESPHSLRNSSDPQNKEKFSQRHWSFYKEVLKERAAPTFAFSQLTEPVASLEPGMKLESLDINNPVNYCVATVIQVLGHRLKIRYDGFGDDSSSDVWFNFQADELYPIGWCASHGYPLQPPTGISSTLAEWKSFLTRTLTGALAAPNDLFKKVENRRALKCHSYLIGDKIEVIHPKKTSVIVPATITKSLGPYYFLVTCDSMPGISSYTFYGYADCPGIFPKGWCESKGLELVIPPEGKGDVHMLFKPDMNIDLGGLKKNRMCSFKLGAKLEALYDDYVRVATVAEIFGGVVLLAFDGSSDVHFIDKRCTNIYPIGWSENTDSVLFTPLGLVTFVKIMKPVKGKVQSASFATFKDLSELNLAKSFEHKQPVDYVDKTLITKSDSKSHDSSSLLASKNNLNMEKFILWLLNNYEFSVGSEVVVSRLLEKYARQSKAPCLSTGIPVILNLFPGTTSITKLFNKNYVQCILNMKASKFEKKGFPIYVKDAVDFLQKCNVSFKMGTDKVVFYMGVGDSFTLPEDQQLLFVESKAKANSNVLVVSQQINDSTLSNFLFYFGDKPCSPPFKEINTFEEFCAMIKLCTMAKPCSGISQKEVKSEFSSLFVKNNQSGVLFSRTCNLVVYSNQGSVCSQCSLCEFKINDSPELSSPSPSVLIEDCFNSKAYYGGFVKREKKDFVQMKTKSESTETITDITCQGTNGSTVNNIAQLDCSSQPFKMTNNKQLIIQPQTFNLSQISENTSCKVSKSLPNDSPICYVVLTKEDNLVNPIQSNSVPSTPLLSVSTLIPPISLHVNASYPKQNMLSSTPKVTQMIENISKTTLLMDIDEPSRSTISKSEVPNELPMMKQSNSSVSLPNLSDFQHRESSPHSHLYQQNNISDMLPPTYQDVVQNHNRNQYENHQYVENICHTMEPAEKQMHVHKMHHGNARVKYVLPAQDRDIHDGKQFISSHYIDGLDKMFQGQVHYPTQRTVSPSSGNICSPLHSPPALRPPPSLHTRSLPLHSPPTLLASPDVRPMFDFISSSNSTPNYQNIRTLTYMQPEKTYSIAHTNVHMPKLPPSFENCQQRTQNHPKPIKFHHIERPQAQKLQYNGNLHLQPMHQQHQPNHVEKQRISPIKSKSFISSDKKNSVAYIPIQASSKENFVYVPVNSVNDVQPVVLYQNNQNKTDQGRQIIIPLHSKDDGRTLKDKIKTPFTKTPFTTVCIQGIHQANYIAKSYSKSVKNNTTISNTPIKISLSSDIKLENVTKTELSNLSETKKTVSCVENIESEPSYKKLNDLPQNVSEALVETNSNSSRFKSEENHKKKKKRGRPPSAIKTNDDSSIISNLPIPCASPLTLQDSNNVSNHLLMETFKKQQDRNNRIKFLIDPISKVPDLPNNPELWSPSDVKKFLLATDCNAHAEVLFKEEVDGRSFLLITQEALVEFMGMRLGPALKIASYAAQLRAQLRVQNINLADGRNSPSHISKIKKARLNDTISKLQEKKISKESSSKTFDSAQVYYDKIETSAVEDDSESDKLDSYSSYKNTVSDNVCDNNIKENSCEKSIKFSTNASENKKNNSSPSESRNKTYVTDIKNSLYSGNLSYPSKCNENVTDNIDRDKKMMDLDVPCEHINSNNYQDSGFPCIKKLPQEQFQLSEPFISSQSFS